MAQVEEIAAGIYCISSKIKESPVTFNQFLIEDERPALIHTGMFPLYSDVRKAVSQIVDPAALQYVVLAHFEGDECGGMGRFVQEAPDSVLVCSEVGAVLNLTQWDYSGPIQGVRDGDVIDLGEHKLRFLETPHVHHWDSLMIWEETTKSLFSSDLFIQPGDQPPVVRENLGKEMCQLYREVGIFGGERPVWAAVTRAEELDPHWIHPMHGGSLPREVIPSYVQALRTQPFVFEGKVFARRLPGWQ